MELRLAPKQERQHQERHQLGWVPPQLALPPGQNPQTLEPSHWKAAQKKPIPKTAGLAKIHTAERMDLHRIQQKHLPHTHREGLDRRMVQARRILKALPQEPVVPPQNALA